MSTTKTSITHLPVLSVHRPSIELESAPADAVIDWALQRFAHQRVIMTTSFGMEGCVLLHMLGSRGAPLDVVTIDTGFFFRETLEVREQMEQRFPSLRFRTVRPALTPAAQQALHGDELWKQGPERCCALRRVEPIHAALSNADVWLTGLSRHQSPERSSLPVVSWDDRYLLVKINPLANWSRSDVWAYAEANDIPINTLHAQGYPSVGCTHCTRSVNGSKPGSYSRAGRWAGSDKTECGIHFGDNI